MTMTTPADFGWADRPCPPWCVLNGDLRHRVDRDLSVTWHKGPETEIPTTDEDHHGDLVIARAFLTQKVEADDRGAGPHPGEVAIDFAGTFTPANARKLAGVLMDLADQAEALTE